MFETFHGRHSIRIRIISFEIDFGWLNLLISNFICCCSYHFRSGRKKNVLIQNIISQFQNSKMPKHFWSVKFTCCWIIERSKTNQLMRSKNFRKCLWKPIRIRTSFGSLKIRKPSRPSEGNEICKFYFTETLKLGECPTEFISFDLYAIVMMVNWFFASKIYLQFAESKEVA